MTQAEKSRPLSPPSKCRSRPQACFLDRVPLSNFFKHLTQAPQSGAVRPSKPHGYEEGLQMLPKLGFHCFETKAFCGCVTTSLGDSTSFYLKGTDRLLAALAHSDLSRARRGMPRWP